VIHQRRQIVVAMVPHLLREIGTTLFGPARRRVLRTRHQHCAAEFRNIEPRLHGRQPGREHEVVALIGASGSGKSTLLRCVDLLDPIDAGAIRLSGEDISWPGYDANAVRRQVGIVFQSFNLFPHLSVLQNVTLGPRKVLKHSKAEADSGGARLLTRFGLGERSADFSDQLSGGQQQRVAIARAVNNRPEMVIADETVHGEICATDLPGQAEHGPDPPPIFPTPPEKYKSAGRPPGCGEGGPAGSRGRTRGGGGVCSSEAPPARRATAPRLAGKSEGEEAGIVVGRLRGADRRG